MKKIDPECKALRPLCERSSLTAYGPNEPISEVESRRCAKGDVPNEGLGQLPDLIENLGKNCASRSSFDSGQTEPVFSSESLIAYEYDRRLARDEKIVITVKTTLQVHKNDRQEAQMKRPSSNVFGREAARHYVQGFVAAFPLSHDRLNWSLAEAEWAFSALEPYSVDIWGNTMALSGGNYVMLIALDTGEATPIHYPWLSQAHTVQFSSDGKSLLVASSGFDAVAEFDTESRKVVWEWFAWDHGFDRSKLGHYVVRSAERSEALKAMGHEVLLVDNPRRFEFGIPTRTSPAHLNSACYNGDGSILVTLFHQGKGIIVDKVSGEVREVVSGLVNPHKLSRRKGGGYFISDTRRGKLVLVDEKFRVVREIALAALPGVERPERLSEFLQNTTELKKDLFACVDIHRNSLWLVDVKRCRYRGIKFPQEWSLHDVASIERDYQFRIGSLVGTAFGRVNAFVREERVICHFYPDGREIDTLTLDAQGRSAELGIQM